MDDTHLKAGSTTFTSRQDVHHPLQSRMFSIHSRARITTFTSCKADGLHALVPQTFEGCCQAAAEQAQTHNVANFYAYVCLSCTHGRILTVSKACGLAIGMASVEAHCQSLLLCSLLYSMLVWTRLTMSLNML